jgi:phosphocarrier protein
MIRRQPLAAVGRAEAREPDSPVPSASEATLNHAAGLHARPAIKLTKLAKRFAAQVHLRAGKDGPWTDAKSIVKVMALKVPQGTLLSFRAQGGDAEQAVAALADLVRRDFEDASAA